MSKNLNPLVLILPILFITSLYPVEDYRVSVEISLTQKEVEESLRTKQTELNNKFVNTFFAEINKSSEKLTPEYQQYKVELKNITDELKANHYKSSELKQLNGIRFADGTNKPFHLTLVYIDDLIDNKDLEPLKQALAHAAQQIIIQFPNGLGDFYIQGKPSLIGVNGRVAYQEIIDSSKNLETMANIISETLKTQTHHSINKDYPDFKAHVSIGLIGHMMYPPKVPQPINPFYKKLLENHTIKENNSLWSGIQKMIQTNAVIGNNERIKFNVNNFTLKIADLRNAGKTAHSEQIYELTGLSAQVIILKNKLEHLKSKLLLLSNQLNALKKQLTQ